MLRLIDEATKKKGWWRTDLAKALKKSDAWLSKIMVEIDKENKKIRKSKKIILSVPALLEIADALGVDPGSLLPGGSKASFDEYLEKKIEEKIEKYKHKK